MITREIANGLVGKLVRVDFETKHGPEKHLGVVIDASSRRITLELPRNKKNCTIRLDRITSVVNLYEGILVHYFSKDGDGNALKSRKQGGYKK
jgi:transcription elongation factor